MKLDLNLNIAKNFLNQQFWNKLALAAQRIVRARTRKGLDSAGQPFKKYSPGYLKKRQAEGIIAADTVNLEFSRQGGMLKAIDHMVSNNLESVTIFFNDKRAEQLAIYHNTMGAGKSKIIRKFFTIETAQEKQQLMQAGYNDIHNLFRSL